jgi:hypothetical protein
LSEISVALTGGVSPPIVTTGNGNYQFSELSVGSNYSVTPSRQGYVFNPPNRTINNLRSDQRADFQGVACIFTISQAISTWQSIRAMGQAVLRLRGISVLQQSPGPFLRRSRWEISTVTENPTLRLWEVRVRRSFLPVMHGWLFYAQQCQYRRGNRPG